MLANCMIFEIQDKEARQSFINEEYMVYSKFIVSGDYGSLEIENKLNKNIKHNLCFDILL